MSKSIICRKCGLEKRKYARGMCQLCYNREWREKNPNYSYNYYRANKERIRLRRQNKNKIKQRRQHNKDIKN